MTDQGFYYAWQEQWEEHRFLGDVLQALRAGHTQFYLYGRNVAEDWFYNSPLLGVQDIRDTLAYNLLYVGAGLVRSVVCVSRAGLTVYLPPDKGENRAALQRRYPRNANELEDLLNGGAPDQESEDVLGDAEPAEDADRAATSPTPLEPSAVLETFHRITRLMSEVEVPFAVIVDGFHWLAELFPSRQHRLELIEELDRWKAVSPDTGYLSFILLNGLEPLSDYLPLEAEDIHTIYVAGPSVLEIADALSDFVDRRSARFDELPILEHEDYLVLATAMKNRGLNLLNAVHLFDRFIIEAPDEVHESAETFIAAFKRLLQLDVADVRWEDVILPEETRDQIEDRLERFLDEDNPNPPKGMLLWGPPGTGKTHIARGLANRGGFTFMPVKLADLKAGYVGQSGQNVKALFAEARASSPTLMFIDEVDSVFGRRGGRDQDSFTNDIVNQFLAETDGVDVGRQRIFIVAATNRPDIVDSAVKSRLPPLEIPLPDAAARRALLLQGLGDELQLDKPVLDHLVERTDGLSGRDLHKVLCEQLIRCYSDGKPDPVASAMRAVRHIVVDRLDTAAAHIELAETQTGGLERIIGYEKIKSELSRMVDQLLNPHPRMQELGIAPGNGVLLHGPPGNGKTSLARALAAEYGLDFLLISGSQLNSAGSRGRGDIGAIDSLVQDAHRIAVTGKGLLLFFDEFDALAQAPLMATFRSALIGNIDRIRRQGKIFLMAATNFYDRLDEAVIRPGRFDRHILIDNPTDRVIQRFIRTWVDQAPFRLACEEAELQELGLRWFERKMSVSAVHTAVEIAKRHTIYEHGSAETLPVTLRDLLEATPNESVP